MKDILSKLFGFLKIILFMISLGMVLYGVLVTYSRLGKTWIDALPIFMPFVFVIITFIISYVIKSKEKSLLVNFVSTVVFITIIIICLRSKFDSNMILYYKYKIGFNPTFFTDNLAIIEIMLYMLGLGNVFLILSHKIKNKKIINEILQEEKEEIIEQL